MLNNKEYLNKIFQSNKPLIIYKTVGGYDVYTDFNEKIVLNSKNLKNFLNKKTLQPKSSIKELNCYVGFFGFQLLCENIKIKLPKQKSLNFYPGLFYKPQTIIKISGFDKQEVGMITSKIKSIRPPVPYKGKGIKEQGQYILRKEGKKK